MRHAFTLIVTCMILLSSSGVRAQESSSHKRQMIEQQKLAQQQFDEYRAMVMAQKYHAKCGGLDALTLEAARITREARQRVLTNAGRITNAQLDGVMRNISMQIDAIDCAELKEHANVKSAVVFAKFFRDFYKLTWWSFIAKGEEYQLFGGDVANYTCGDYTYAKVGALAQTFDNAARKRIIDAHPDTWRIIESNATNEAILLQQTCKANPPGANDLPLVQFLKVVETEQAKQAG
jgi:hypothetical protein